MQLVVAAVVIRDGRVLVTRRVSPPELAGLWEFPGGKVEPGEEPTAALQRELVEELDLQIIPGPELVAPEGFWPISDRLHMRVWYAICNGEEVVGESHDEVRWITRQEFSQVNWVPADVAVAAAVADRELPLDLV